MHSKHNILILGAGPTGLGAAYRLEELGYKDYLVVEKAGFPGGLATTLKDKQGFYWDLGGHVVHSHYLYFDQVLDKALGKDYLEHQREAWIWMMDRFIPYPFQNNIRLLPKHELLECLDSLINLPKAQEKPGNFEEWIYQSFGRGIAETFMIPYNRKVWAIGPDKMSYNWIGDRVAVVDLKRILKNIIFEQEDVSWGPNATFKFPQYGGTGRIWQNVFKLFPPAHFLFNQELLALNTKKKEADFTNHHLAYDYLINTIPLDSFMALSDFEAPWIDLSQGLVHNSIFIIGVGMQGQPPDVLKSKCWIYFPEKEAPFHRITIFSNYSPHNVPLPGKQWSIMAEVSFSPWKDVPEKNLKEHVVEALVKAGYIKSSQVISLFLTELPYGYPVPTLERDTILDTLLPLLESREIFSRGRFGAWKYEVSNQDHSFMQGKEVIDRILQGGQETTLNFPAIANKGY